MKAEDFRLKANSNWYVMREVFEDLNDLATYVKTQPTNKIFKNECLASQKSKQGSFNDFDSFEDALKAMEYGYNDYLKDFQKEMKKTKEFMSKSLLNKNGGTKKDVVGFMPIVPNVIIGNPVNMLNQNINPRKTPVCKMIIEKAMLCGVTAEDNIRYFSVLFTLIQEIENRGIRCELWLCAVSEKSDSRRNEISACKIKLKDALQPINIYKLQFPIISADMFRRIGFRLKEITPTMEADWTWGYGSTLINQNRSYYKANKEHRPNKGMQEILDISEDYIYIPNVEDAKCENADTEEILDFFLKKTALKHYLDIK